MTQSVIELKKRAEESELTPESTSTEHCGNCKFYDEMKEDIGYCAHEKVDMTVGDPWWCQYWEQAKS